MDRQKFQIVGLQESLHQRLLRHYDWCQLTEWVNSSAQGLWELKIVEWFQFQHTSRSDR